MSLLRKLTQKFRPKAVIGDLEVKSHSYRKDYTIQKETVLGEGMNGKVHVCYSVEKREKFAVKILPDSRSSRTEVELQLLCSAEHEGIAKIHDVYSNTLRGKLMLVVIMECVEGGDLFDRIIRRTKQPFTEKRVAEITKEILLAVSHIHDLNIAHRDIKPENILLSDNSDAATIKLIDFGFAKACLGSDSLSTPCFTPYYAAPEIFSDNKYDKSCDAWSIGVIVYILMSGYPPFTSSKKDKRQPLSRGMKQRIQNGEFVFPERYWSKVSAAGMDFIRALLKPDTKERMSVHEALQHEWLTVVAPSKIVPLIPEEKGKSSPVVPSKAPKVDAEVAAAVKTEAESSEDESSPDGTATRIEVASAVKPMASVAMTNPLLARRRAAKANSETDSAISVSPITTPSLSISSSANGSTRSSTTTLQDSSTIPAIVVDAVVRASSLSLNEDDGNVFMTAVSSSTVKQGTNLLRTGSAHDSGISLIGSTESIYV